ncbi:unnamed protein product [Lampetra planeri]
MHACVSPSSPLLFGESPGISQGGWSRRKQGETAVLGETLGDGSLSTPSRTPHTHLFLVPFTCELQHRCSESLRRSVTATIIPTPGHFSALRPSEQGLRLSRVEFGDEEEE